MKKKKHSLRVKSQNRKMWQVDGSNGGHLQMLAKEMTDKDAENAALEVCMSACCTYTAYLWILQHTALPHSGRRQIWRNEEKSLRVCVHNGKHGKGYALFFTISCYAFVIVTRVFSGAVPRAAVAFIFWLTQGQILDP